VGVLEFQFGYRKLIEA